MDSFFFILIILIQLSIIADAIIIAEKIENAVKKINEKIRELKTFDYEVLSDEEKESFDRQIIGQVIQERKKITGQYFN